MNPTNPIAPVTNPPAEQVLLTIKRHPIGILGIYLASVVMLIAVAAGVFGLLPKVFTSYSSGQVYAIASIVYLVFALIVLAFVYIAHIVYWSNIWQLSAESLNQVTRTSLFDQQTSHLSLGNMQDVTAAQDGILQQMFNYGSLRVETAGERSKFVFLYCPEPNKYAQQILSAKEAIEQARMNNNGLNIAYSAPYNQPQSLAPANITTPPST